MSERWAAAARVFEEALALPAAERDAFLARRCAGDAQLAAEVRSLLSHHDRSEEFLEPGGGESRAIEAVAGELGGAGTGQRYGAWVVVRPIGEGGMGVVYLAERTEGGFQQRGALKRVRSAMPTGEMVRRFVRERQILATLEHPHIARLLDGGTADDGLPWLVMEYVEGQPLYEFCSERALSLNARIELFLSVCSAVAYAHQRLVLHRDIKPGNLLVPQDGAPRLLDFGIAKLFGDEGPSDGAGTHTVHAPMTPEYASPEQLRGEPVGTASDVYSLGVLLYELLTGTRPYPPSTGVPDFARLVMEHVPERPSTAVRTRARTEPPTTGGHRRLPAPPAGGPASLRKRLAGDLDNIVLMAMHKDAARRYASVEQLAEDLRRYLGGFPVRARPDSWGYRASRFAYRNRGRLTAGAIATLALLAALGLALWQASVARRESVLAQHRFQDVHALTQSLLFEVNDAIADLPGATRARELIVQRATEYLARLSSEAGNDDALKLDLARAYLRLGQIQGQPQIANVGKGDEAYRSLKAAQLLLAGLERRRPNDAEVVTEYLNACNSLTMHGLDHGRPEEALAMQRVALRMNERLVTLMPDSAKYRLALPKRRFNLGMALQAADRDSEAVIAMRTAVGEFDALARRSPDDLAASLNLARALSGYAQFLSETLGPVDSVEAAARRSLTLYERALAARPGEPDLMRRVGKDLFTLAECVAHRRGRPAEALPLARRANELMHRAVASDPGNVDLKIGEAIGLSNEGTLLAEAGRHEQAEAMLKAALALAVRIVAADTSNTNAAGTIAAVHGSLGDVVMARARHAAGPAARALWRAAKAHYVQASSLRAELAARGDVWARASTLRAPEAAGLAACDSALADEAGR